MTPRRSIFLAWILLMTLTGLATPASSAAGSTVVSNSLGMTVAVEADGRYRIDARSPQWTFGGQVEKPRGRATVHSGADGIGRYSEIRFSCQAPGPQLAVIRLYHVRPVVLFSDTCLKRQTNELAFPRLSTCPKGLYHFGYRGSFARYDFHDLSLDSPWLFFDGQLHSFILSPATNYMIASDTREGDGGPICCGINSAIPALPDGFTHRTVLVVENGIQKAFGAWGRALTRLSGKVRPANDASVVLNKLGYWTDHGAAYYYKFEPGKGCEATLEAIRDEFARKGAPLGYLQLDSWWYLKGAPGTWRNGGGIYRYQAAPELFPRGLAAFQRQLGLPLVVHARWVDPASPYRKDYAISRNAPIDPRYWTMVMAYLKRSGVVTYEQDWLNEKTLPLMNLRDPGAFMNHMARAAADEGINLQYCMPLPRHYLEGTLYNNLLTMRVSDDRFEKNNWNADLYTSMLVGALGAYPWTDVFRSREERNLLLSTLSAGPVGVGDRLGAVNATNLLRAVRADGVIVKPDTPLVPLDETFLNDARGENLPMVAATYTDHANWRAAYVFAFARIESNAVASFVPARLGIPGMAYVYDYFAHSGRLVKPGAAFRFTTTPADNFTGGSYFIVSPVGPSGIALLGDTNLFVTLGRKRISNVADSGVLRVRVRFATGEKRLVVAGYAPSKPRAAAVEGSVQLPNYDKRFKFFSVAVTPGNDRGATVMLQLRHNAGMNSR